MVTKIQNNNNKITHSEKFEITYRTAQGSCLGLLLFVLFVNDIYLLPLLGKLILFADNTTLLESHRKKNYLNFALEHNFLHLIDWFKANKLSLNISKTVAMEYHNNQVFIKKLLKNHQKFIVIIAVVVFKVCIDCILDNKHVYFHRGVASCPKQVLQHRPSNHVWLVNLTG